MKLIFCALVWLFIFIYSQRNKVFLLIYYCKPSINNQTHDYFTTKEDELNE